MSSLLLRTLRSLTLAPLCAVSTTGAASASASAASPAAGARTLFVRIDRRENTPQYVRCARRPGGRVAFAYSLSLTFPPPPPSHPPGAAQAQRQAGPGGDGAACGGAGAVPEAQVPAAKSGERRHLPVRHAAEKHPPQRLVPAGSEPCSVWLSRVPRGWCRGGLLRWLDMQQFVGGEGWGKTCQHWEGLGWRAAGTTSSFSKWRGHKTMLPTLARINAPEKGTLLVVE